MKPVELADEAAGTRPFTGPLVVTVLAGALQYAISVPIAGGQIRVISADVAVPFVVAGLLTALALRSFRLPEPRGAWVAYGLAGLTLVMTYAVLAGRFYMGQWSSWGLLNKYAGWYALLAYFGTGALLVAAYGPAARDFFVSTFVAFAWIICGFEAVDVLLRVTGAGPGGLIARPDAAFRGLMVNPNAFAFLVLTAICLQAAYVRERALWVPTWIYRAGLAVLCIGLVYSRSRGTWVALPVAAAFLIWHRRELAREFALAAAMTAAFIALPNLLLSISPGAWFTAPSLLQDTENELNRVALSLDALRLWTQYPVFGAGLGHHLAVQAAQTPDPLIIHNTGLWLLTETGLIGAAAFTAFFAASVVTLRRFVAPGAPFMLAALAVCLGFAVISVTHEVMYQRYLWLILGMALVRTRGAPWT